jgi:hypothetical protein
VIGMYCFMHSLDEASARTAALGEKSAATRRRGRGESTGPGAMRFAAIE